MRVEVDLSGLKNALKKYDQATRNPKANQTVI